MNRIVVTLEPTDEKRFALAQTTAPRDRVGGGSSGSDLSRTKTSASLNQRSFRAWLAL